MLEQPKFNKQQEIISPNTEAMKKRVEVAKQESAGSSPELVQNKKTKDLLRIEELRKSLISRDISDILSAEKEVRELGFRQALQKEKYDTNPQELGALAWEDKADKARETIEVAESRLALSEDEFQKMFGELSGYMKQAIPQIIEQNKKLLEEYTAAAKAIREKV